MNSIDLRQSDWTKIIIAFFSFLSFLIGILAFNDQNFLVSLCGIGFGMLGPVYFILQFFFNRGNSGVVFDLQGFEVHTADGKKYRYQYSDLEFIAIQEMMMPGVVNAVGTLSKIGTLVYAPANLFLLPEVYENEFLCIAFKFRPGIQIPITGSFDTYLYAREKLGYWGDDYKLDLYYALYNNVDFNKRKKLFEFLQTRVGIPIMIYPPLQWRSDQK